MLTIEPVDVSSRSHVHRFVDIPYRLYRHQAQWVPPLRMDVNLMLNKTKHPYYEHSTADFFIAVRDGRDVGRIGALENKPFNTYHHTRQAQFYLFECEDDLEAATALIRSRLRVGESARSR